MITTAASNPDVTKAGDFVFMASVTDAFQGKVLAQFAITELDVTTAAILTLSGDVYTEGISEFFTLNFSKFGGEIVANESYESGAMDFTEHLTSIAATQPEAFFISSFARDIGPITQQARAISLQNAVGTPTLFLGTDTWDNEVLLADEDAEVEGSFLRHTFHRAQMKRQHERLLTLINLFTERHQQAVSPSIMMPSNCFLKQSNGQAVSHPRRFAIN